MRKVRLLHRPQSVTQPDRTLERSSSARSRKRGQDRPISTCPTGVWSLTALLATLVLLFGLQGEQTIRQATVIALLAVPIVLPDTSDPQMGVGRLVARGAAMVGGGRARGGAPAHLPDLRRLARHRGLARRGPRLLRSRPPVRRGGLLFLLPGGLHPIHRLLSGVHLPLGLFRRRIGGFLLDASPHEPGVRRVQAPVPARLKHNEEWPVLNRPAASFSSQDRLRRAVASVSISPVEDLRFEHLVRTGVVRFRFIGFVDHLAYVFGEIRGKLFVLSRGLDRLQFRRTFRLSTIASIAACPQRSTRDARAPPSGE
jgi:hypothetical protein